MLILVLLWLIPPSAGAEQPASNDSAAIAGAAKTGASDGVDPRPAGDEDDDLDDIKDALGADAKSRAADGATARPRGVAATLASMNPDLSFAADMSLAAFSDAEANQQTGAHDPEGNGFHLQQLEMTIGSAVDPYFRLDGSVVFSEHGVEVEELFGTATSLPYNLQARMGQMLTRVGRINETHPHAWDFVDQPLLIGRYFGGEGNRGVGVELSYLTPLPWFVEVVAMMNNASGEGVRSFGGDDELEVDSPMDFQSSLMVKQFFDLSDNLSLLWGLSAVTGPNANGDGKRTHILGTDVYVKYRPITRASYTIVSLQAEWMFRQRDEVPRRLRDHGGYAQLFHRFARRWGWATRYEYGSPAKTKTGLAEGDSLDPEWTQGRHRGTGAITFWPSEFSRIRLQGSADWMRWRDEPVYGGFLTFSYVIGKHGAHKF